jgi:hypothetical protein
MLSNVIMAIGKVIRGSRDGKGRVRKLIEVREDFYDQYEFGDWVTFEKLKNEQTS